MSEELAPWLAGAGEQSEVAPWLQPQVSVGEDVAKTAPSALARGVIGLAGLGGDLQKFATHETGDSVNDWLTSAAGKVGEAVRKYVPYGNEIADAYDRENERAKSQPIAQIGSGDVPGSYKLPTSADIEHAVTDKTGYQFYDPKTAAGRVVNVAGEVAPSLFAGGETLPATIMKAAGSGGVSEGLGDLAAKGKQYLPESMQPYAEPVARGVGAVIGVGAPATVRRAVTPLPMTDPQAATVAALRQTNPELVQASTAGQLTDTPGLRALEGRTANNTEAQERAFTQGAMRTMGADTPSYSQGIQHGENVGNELRNLRESNNINAPATQSLYGDVRNMRNQFVTQYGNSAAQPLDDAIREVFQFKAGPTGPFIPGARYGMLMQNLQTAIEGAPNSQTKMALSALRGRLKSAFQSSVPQAVADREDQLAQQYANYSALSNVKPNIGRDTITPEEALSASTRQQGAQRVNRNMGDIAPLAQNAGRVMHELPEASHTAPPSFNLLMTILNGAAGSGADAFLGGHGAAGAGAEGAVLGHLVADPVWNLGGNAASRLANSRPAQAYLGNQLWRPGVHTSAPDRETLLRLLMAPPVNQLEGK